MLAIGSILLALWTSKCASLTTAPAQGVTIPLKPPRALVYGGRHMTPRALSRNVAYVFEKYRYRGDVDTEGAYRFSRSEGPDISLCWNNTISRRAKQEYLVLKSYNDFSWTASVTIDDQELEFLLDTGSADNVVPGINCDGCQGHTPFVPEGRPLKEYTLRYGDGSVTTGQVHSASISVGGLAAENVAVGVATYYSPHFSKERFPADGILAFGFSALSVFKELTLIDELYMQGQIERRVFCFKLGATRLGSTGSTLDLGRINTDLYIGEITWLAVVRQSYWEVILQSILLGDQEFSFGLNGTGVKAIIDTGSHMISAPRSLVEAFYDKISTAKPAPAHFSGIFPIHPWLFTTARIDDIDCIGGLGVGPFDDAIIIGSVFLSNVYSIFDVDQGQVGFASLASV